MSKKFICLICFCLFALIPVTTYSQGVYEAWVARYNGPANANSDDYARALAVDASGNVYVTGSSWSDTSIDYATIKYSSAGDALWLRRYNGPGNGGDVAYALAVDDSGNVYVTGSSFGGGATINDYATIKYSPFGDTLWVKSYYGPGTSDDVAKALAVDDSGNVYVTGSSWSGSFYDYATIKYSSSGDTLWVRRYNEVGFDDAASALAVDDSGNVYVTGYSVGFGTSGDYATIKYNSFGDTLWVRRYNSPANNDDYARALAVDASGNVYVTGTSTVSGTSTDYATIKYSSAGDTVWVRRYNGPGNDIDGASALAVDASGNVYVTGRSIGFGTSGDYATIKYNSFGDTLWVRRYNGPGNGGDAATALAVDDSGNVYVTGSSWSGSFYDYVTIKYSSSGDTRWVRRYNGPANSLDEASALAVDDSGNVYVTGYSGGDYATIKYSPCSASSPLAGDANANSTYTLGDVISIVNYVFNKPGCSPQPLCWLSGLLCRGDWDGSNDVTLGDVIQGVNYIFNKPGGPWNALPSGLCCSP
jgi:uncharacterized delta-60 repeat protein